MIQLLRNNPERAIANSRFARKSPLRLIEYIEDLLGEAHGFGSFLFNTDGEVVVHQGKTWLYTTALNGTKWESWVRTFEISTLKAGPARRVLASIPEDRRGAVLHHVFSVAPDFFVGFFSGGSGVRAAMAAAPDGPFKREQSFRMNPVQGWETHGGAPDNWFLEANGAFVKIDENAAGLIFWEGYDSYLVRGRLGDMAWAKIMVDKNKRKIKLLERHPQNPLPFRDSGWSCARCGGNLSSDVKIDGRRAFFYYFRPLASRNVYIGLALSTDPLFQTDTEHFVVDTMRGQEEVSEKFQVLQQNGELLLFSENRFTDGSWHTGMRRFQVM